MKDENAIDLIITETGLPPYDKGAPMDNTILKDVNDTPYKFKSGITARVLATGVNRASQVTRQEALKYLSELEDAAGQEFYTMGKLFVTQRLKDTNFWDIESFIRELTWLQEDIAALKEITEVTGGMGEDYMAAEHAEWYHDTFEDLK
ncbi:MAG: hypothetical protein EBR82_74880 [Caulobacteraceae bacterium]|nr:hypothetical protein [Caulobacteraceae bacterium]